MSNYQELLEGLNVTDAQRIRLEVRDDMLRKAYEQWLIEYGFTHDIEDYCLTQAKEAIMVSGEVRGFKNKIFKKKVQHGERK